MSDDVIRSRVGGFREPIASKPLAFWGAILLGVVASTAFFWNGLVSLIDAWGQPEYSHGPLIPVISAFLLFRQLRDTKMADGPITDRWPGVVLCVLALLLAGIGNITQIPDLVTYGLIAWVGALLLARYGWRRGRVLWPPVLHLVFMLPLPVFVAWQFSLFLQFISSEIGVALIQLMNVPVYLDGNIIDLGVYKLHVAEACSGLRYLFPILSFSYIFAILYQGPIWHKAVLLLSAAPIAILMNSLRIGIIGYMVNSYGIEHAEGFLHLFEGWVIFGLCILALLGLAW
ncbi:MAG: exosortase, partial [Pseudomonadota bacterium]